MRKRIAILLGAAVVLSAAILLRTGRGPEPTWTTDETPVAVSDGGGTVTWALVPDALTASSAGLRIDNVSGDVLHYDHLPILQVLRDGAWRTMRPAGDVQTPTEDYRLASGESVTLAERWDDLYGELPDGTYRLIRTFYRGEELPAARENAVSVVLLTFRCENGKAAVVPEQ